MPKGEHFKKNNPRNYQVSFKVSKQELLKIQEYSEKSGLSVAEWFRSIITEEPAMEIKAIEPKNMNVKAEKGKKNPPKKSAPGNGNSQMSLFG